MIISTDQAHKILIVSDDLTGACDAASPFCEHGFRVKVLVDPVKSFQTLLFFDLQMDTLFSEVQK